MSNLWSRDDAGAVSSVGSFAIERAEPIFTPWGSGSDGEGDGAPGAELDLETIRAEAFAEGWNEGRRTAELEFAADRDALARLAESLEVLRPEPTDALALVLAETVERLVRQIMGRVAIDAALLARRAAAAAELVRDQTAPTRIRLHPDDLPLIEAARIPVDLTADPALERGCLVLETGEGWIEDGPAIRLERLRAELDRMSAA